MLEGMTTAANGRKRRAGGRKGTWKEGRKEALPSTWRDSID